MNEEDLTDDDLNELFEDLRMLREDLRNPRRRRVVDRARDALQALREQRDVLLKRMGDAA